MKLLVATTLLLFSFLDLPAQHMLTAAELKEDISVLRKALQTTYPSLYRYNDSITITTYLDRKINEVHSAQTVMSAYRHVVEICSRMNDEHVIATPPAWYNDSLQKAKHFFPFSIKLIGRRMYVLHGFKLPHAFPPGSEIISINGRPVEELLNRLSATIPSDGYIQTFNVRHLEDYSMTQNNNLFDLNYPIFIENVDSFRIEFLSPKDKQVIRTITLAGLDWKNYQEFYRQRRTWKAPLEFKFLQNDIAYMRVYSFHRGHRDAFNQNFSKLYDSVFSLLKKRGTRNLILDLRNNEGGDDTGSQLLAYLLRKPYRLLDYLEEKFTGYPAVKEYLENGEELLFQDSLVFLAPSGLYRLKEKYTESSPLFSLQRPAVNHFTGSLYVLSNGSTGSMAAVVTSFLKHHKRATLIGEECGGAMEGPTSMAYAQLVLPNSKIRVEIPLTKSVHLLDYEKGRGAMPDYHVEPNIDNLLNGIDDELNYAQRLIKEQKKNND